MTRATSIRLTVLVPLVLVLGTLVSAGGCSFHPTFSEGTIACNAAQPSSCPPGFSCQGGFCRSRPLLDSSVDKGEAGDVPVMSVADSATTDQVAVAGDSLRDGTLPSDLATGDSAGAGVDRAADLAVGLAVDLGVDRIEATQDGASALEASAAEVVVIPDAGGDSSLDVPACSESCKAGDTRCGTGGGMQTCRIVNACPVWGNEVPCDGRKTCQGLAPAAVCACPAPPAGCEGGAGIVCGGNTRRTCSVGAVDGCIFEASSLVCPDKKPCQGSFPKADCTCPTPPTDCNGTQGTLCVSSTMVESCGLDGNGCLAILQQTTCPTGKPCVGSFPAANCSCPAAPAECLNAAGTVCLGITKVETCGLDSFGCIAITATTDCPVGKSCQGNHPSASCQCPAPPAECSQGVGQSCDALGREVSCTKNANGCMTVSYSPCPGSKTCQGSFPSASCRCPAQPSNCASAGTVCLDGYDVTNCSMDGNGCLVASTSPCATGTVCVGSFPSATCACPTAPIGCGSGVGSSCSGTDVLVCTKNTSGCLVANTTACPTGKPCTGSFPSSACTCPSPPSYCPSSGEGLACADSNTLVKCSHDVNGCVVTSTVSSCSLIGEVCISDLSSAKCSCPPAPSECSLGAGSSCPNTSTELDCTANTYGCVSSSTTTCAASQYCYGAFPSGKCAAPIAVGWPVDLGSFGNRAAGYLLGHPVTLTTASVLRKFGLIIHSATSAQAQIGLYTDVGGVPSARVAFVSGVSLVAGRNEFAPTWPSGAPTLAAGTYWIMVVYDVQVSVAQDTQISAPRRYLMFTYGNVLPDPMPTTTNSPAAQANYYILVTPQ